MEAIEFNRSQAQPRKEQKIIQVQNLAAYTSLKALEDVENSAKIQY